MDGCYEVSQKCMYLKYFLEKSEPRLKVGTKYICPTPLTSSRRAFDGHTGASFYRENVNQRPKVSSTA